jgi:hypothetical protein
MGRHELLTLATKGQQRRRIAQFGVFCLTPRNGAFEFIDDVL